MFLLNFTKRRVLFFILLSLLHCLPANAQSPYIDSLKKALLAEKGDTSRVKTLNLLSDKLWHKSNYDSALNYAFKARDLAGKIGFKKGIALAYSNSGVIYWNQGNYNMALKDDSIALASFIQTGDKKNTARLLGNIGLVYWNKGNYPKALEYDFKALDMMKEMKNKGGISAGLGNIGIIYEEQGNYSKAIEFQLQSLDIDKQLDNKTDIAADYGNIGNLYFDEGNYKTGLGYQLQALALNLQLGNKTGVANNQTSIGLLYRRMGDLTKALEYQLKALEIDREIGSKNGAALVLCNIGNLYEDMATQKTSDPGKRDSLYLKALNYDLQALALGRETGNRNGIASNLCNIGIVYTRKGKYKPARLYLDSALALSKEIGEKLNIEGGYFGLSMLDSASGDYKASLGDYKKYVAYKDSLINEGSTKKIVQSEMNFEFEQKHAAEKAEQDKKDALASQELKKQAVIRNSFIGGFGLMLVLAFFIFRGLREKQKANAIITRQKDEVEKQKLVVEEKNKEILDSISYAKRLQEAILPPKEFIDRNLPENFVIYKPKDIVAGDFYWAERLGDRIFIAAADSTGHGVPGCMVSVVCSNALNRSLKEFQLTDTGKILDKTRELVLETFEKSTSEVKDGMDISLLCMDRKNAQITWSGANNPLWYIAEGKLTEIKADKQPIGQTDHPKPFTTHCINASINTTFYLFTDGLADQFGGPNGKKYKFRQLEELLVSGNSLPLPELEKIVNRSFEAWKGTLEQVDDICVIGIRI